jgi:hypothetical protein
LNSTDPASASLMCISAPIASKGRRRGGLLRPRPAGSITAHATATIDTKDVASEASGLSHEPDDAAV